MFNSSPAEDVDFVVFMGSEYVRTIIYFLKVYCEIMMPKNLSLLKIRSYTVCESANTGPVSEFTVSEQIQFST